MDPVQDEVMDLNGDLHPLHPTPPPSSFASISGNGHRPAEVRVQVEAQDQVQRATVALNLCAGLPYDAIIGQCTGQLVSRQKLVGTVTPIDIGRHVAVERAPMHACAVHALARRAQTQPTKAHLHLAYV